MRKIENLLLVLLVLPLLLAGCREQPAAPVESQSITEPAPVSADPLPTNTESDDVTFVEQTFTYSNPCVIRSDEIRSDAEIERWYHDGCFAFPNKNSTEYMFFRQYHTLDPMTTRKDLIGYISLKVRVDELTSFACQTCRQFHFSDGSIVENRYMSGFTWLTVTVTGVTDVANPGGEGFFDAEKLVGQQLGVRKNRQFWYENENGQQIKMAGYKVDESLIPASYGYLPRPGEEIILTIVAINQRDGFSSINADTVLEKNQKFRQRYCELMDSVDSLTADDIVGLCESEDRDFLLDFYSFIPSVDLNGNEINNTEQMEAYLLSLDHYFEEKAGDEPKEPWKDPWGLGYFGDIMPPEINDVLRNISIGFE